ncbi:MAG: hypothetical protein JF587_22475 [Catenulisporales bacterium]|nr:hypothetical protein [Catenulisporales bacterium]
MSRTISKLRVGVRARRSAAVLFAAGVLTAMTAGLASASAPNPGFRTVAAGFDASGNVTSVLPVNFAVGDCTLFNGSTIAVTKPTANGVVFFNWHAQAFTAHTNNADIWHGTFTFKTAFGTVIGTIGPLDGARMTQINHVYSWDVPGNATFDPALFGAITQVVWRGEC